MKTFSGGPLLPSPVETDDFDVKDEALSHVILEGLGLGGLGLLLAGLKLRAELQTLNNGPNNVINYKPKGFMPNQMFKPH